MKAKEQSSLACVDFLCFLRRIERRCIRWNRRKKVKKTDSERPMTRVADVAAKHGGNTHGVNAPTDSSVTFIVDDPDDFGRWFMGADGVPDGKYLYARQSHPAAVHLGKMLAVMEGAEAGYVSASGISACNIAMLRFACAGDTIVVSDRLYGGTRMFCNMINERWAIKVIPVDITDLHAVEFACTHGGGSHAKLLFTEVISNPDLVVATIPALAEITRRCGIPLIVDNTFTPLVISPIALGADIVVHSLTKYVSGTSKVIAGGIAGKRDFIRSLQHPSTGLLMLLGPVLSPEVADKLREHFAALPLRFAEASRRAMDAALWLSDEGFPVLYPGLPSSLGFNLFLSMANEASHGGVFSAVLDSYKEAKRFTLLLSKTGFAKISVSLGSAHTYAFPYGSDETFPPLWKKPLPFAPIPQGLVRIAMGYEGDWRDMSVRLLHACAMFQKNA